MKQNTGIVRRSVFEWQFVSAETIRISFEAGKYGKYDDADDEDDDDEKKRVVNTIPGRGSNLFDLFSGKFIIFLHQRAYRKIMVLLERK